MRGGKEPIASSPEKSEAKYKLNQSDTIQSGHSIMCQSIRHSTSNRSIQTNITYSDQYNALQSKPTNPVSFNIGRSIRLYSINSGVIQLRPFSQVSTKPSSQLDNIRFN